MSPAVFLDRDGVLVQDAGLVTSPEAFQILPGVPEALRRLKGHGYALVVITNQTIVARGMVSEAEVCALHQHLRTLLIEAGAPPLDAWYFCPHHPKATLASYRTNCECRKPRPGLLLRAGRELSLDLGGSFAVGDRITDIIAGSRAGCRTILVETGRHLEPPIETSEPLDEAIRPDYVCADLLAAADWMLKAK